MPVRGPRFELGVTGRADADPQRFALPRHVHRLDDLRVAAIEAFGQPNERPKQAYRTAVGRREILESLVILLRFGLAVIARGERDHLDLVGIEPAQIAVLDEVVRVLVVALVADVIADVVQERAVLEPLALARAGAVQAGRRVE